MNLENTDQLKCQSNLIKGDDSREKDLQRTSQNTGETTTEKMSAEDEKRNSPANEVDMQGAKDTDKGTKQSESPLQSVHMSDYKEVSKVTSKLGLLKIEGLGQVQAQLERPPSNVSVSNSKQRIRERNPITGAGMEDRDYRVTVPTFKIHGPQRKESNPLNFEGYSSSNKIAYQMNVEEASISPLKRTETPDQTLGKATGTVSEVGLAEERPANSGGPSSAADIPKKPVIRQRQRERNPITGYGMEDRDFRVGIPTFKAHGPQRREGNPVRGSGYEKVDKEYQAKVQQASDSTLKGNAKNAAGR